MSSNGNGVTTRVALMALGFFVVGGILVAIDRGTLVPLVAVCGGVLAVTAFILLQQKR